MHQTMGKYLSQIQKLQDSSCDDKKKPCRAFVMVRLLYQMVPTKRMVSQSCPPRFWPFWAKTWCVLIPKSGAVFVLRNKHLSFSEKVLGSIPELRLTLCDKLLREK